MKIRAGLFLCFYALGILTSCNAPFRPVPNLARQDPSIQYQTVSASLTQTVIAAVAVTSTVRRPTENLTQTPGLQTQTSTLPPSPVKRTASLTPARTPDPPGGQHPLAPCDLAQPGRPIDITVPDETRFLPGEAFSKTWRLVNAGGCSWTREYALVWFSGDGLGANPAQLFNAEVLPGQVVDVTVDMIAPQNPGAYQSNWKLRNAQGALFGIGPGGRSPFWVRIVVMPFDTATASAPTPVLTTTPQVYAAGTVTLYSYGGVDLDSGQLDLEWKNDLVFNNELESLSPANSTRVAGMGTSMPGFDDCRKAELSDGAFALDRFYSGSYLCYRTSEGLPGRALLVASDLQKKSLVLEFVTWLVP